MLETIFLHASSALAGLCAGFLGGYMRKKGENVATKKDIAELTRITEETKEIVVNRSWDRQRQWELRCDAVVSAIQAANGLRDFMVQWSGFEKHIPVSEEKDNEHLAFVEKFNARYFDFRDRWHLAAFVGGKSLDAALRAFSGLVTTQAMRLTQSQAINPRADEDIAVSCFFVVLQARAELGLSSSD